MTTTQIAWLAGLIEGEGSFSYPTGSVTIALGMTDRDTVEKAAAMMRRPVYEERKLTSGGLSVYRITCHGMRAAGWMMTLYPLMSQRRQARIRELLARWRVAPGRWAGDRKPRQGNKSGVTGVFWDQIRSLWAVQICVKSKSRHVGRYKSIGEALAARTIAQDEARLQRSGVRPVPPG